MEIRRSRLTLNARDTSVSISSVSRFAHPHAECARVEARWNEPASTRRRKSMRAAADGDKWLTEKAGDSFLFGRPVDPKYAEATVRISRYDG